MQDFGVPGTLVFQNFPGRVCSRTPLRTLPLDDMKT